LPVSTAGQQGDIYCQPFGVAFSDFPESPASGKRKVLVNGENMLKQYIKAFPLQASALLSKAEKHRLHVAG